MIFFQSKIRGKKPKMKKYEENEEPDYISWYCKCKLAEGTPMGIYETKKDKTSWVKGLPSYITRYKVRIEAKLNNTDKHYFIKKSGATTALHIWICRDKYGNPELLKGGD